MVNLTSLKIWAHWEQADSGGSGFPGRGDTGFTGSLLVVINLALLVGSKLALLVGLKAASVRTSR